MKTKKEFIKKYSSNPELAKAVLKQGGLTWQEIKEMRWDVYDPSSGSVPGMIYYEDTVKFAKDNYINILKSLYDFEKECGLLDRPHLKLDETQYYNWLAWFAWESTMGEVLDYLEAY